MLRIVLIAAFGLSALPALPQDAVPDPVFSGTITDLTRPEAVWMGGIEVRLRNPFVSEENREAALAHMGKLAAPGRQATCRMTGERTGDDGTLLGYCAVYDPDARAWVDLGASLIDMGLARPCAEDVPTIAIWPPVFNCQ